MKLVIGLVAKPCAGKGTFVELLQAALPKKTSLVTMRFSDVLVETLQLWGIENNRENKQLLAQLMVKGYGEGALSKAVKKLALQNGKNADILVLDGVRWPSDAALVKEFPESVLVYITTDVKTRWRREQMRARDAGDATKTFEQFLKLDNAKNERFIDEIGKDADYCFDNSENDEKLERFRRFVKKLYNTVKRLTKARK